MAFVKRVLLGRPLASAEQEHQRIPTAVGLAVLASDAISSTAYATEEILFVTAVGASSLALGLDALLPIAIAVAILLIVVVTSYRRTILAYPGGGGSYVVSRENLGRNASLLAGASILVDYILTVAVAVSAGVAAIVSIPTFEGMRDQRVLLCLIFVAIITVLNLRGIKESGRVFAVPTYVYIVLLTALVVIGLAESALGEVAKVSFDKEAFEGTKEAGGTLGLFLILKGFSSGAVALTGVEAIADGVPAFKKPSARNAVTALIWMAIILGTLFLGTALLAEQLHPYPSHDQTVIAQMAEQVFGRGPVFFLLQIATALILALAANTAYADFPRLSSIIASDGFLPRQFANRGDRLVFSNGIVFLSGAAALIIVGFGGVTNALIPLYAVGVFTSFTLSQLGMVRYQARHRESKRWRIGAAVSAAGAAATFIVLAIVLITKFTSGAWLPFVLIPAIVLLFKGIRRHYDSVAEALHVDPGWRPPRMNHTVIVLVGRVHRGVLQALAYAKSLNPNRLLAVSMVSEPAEQEQIGKQWAEYDISVPLEIIYSPYRELSRPVLRFVDELDAQYENDVVTIVIPEFVVSHWWEHLLHNQSALILKGRLLFRKDVVVVSVPYHLRRDHHEPS